MSTPCFLPGISSLHLPTILYIRKLKCYFNQTWKEITEWFITDLLNLSTCCFRSHPWGFFSAQQPPGMTNPEKTAVASCFALVFECSVKFTWKADSAKENLVQSLTNSVQLYRICRSNLNHLHRMTCDRLCITDPRPSDSLNFAPGSIHLAGSRESSSLLS